MKKRKIIFTCILLAVLTAVSGCQSTELPDVPDISDTIVSVSTPSGESSSSSSSSDGNESTSSSAEDTSSSSSAESESTSSSTESTSSTENTSSSSTESTNSEIPPIDIPKPTDEVIFSNGIAIVGTRAMSLYVAGSSNFVSYAEALNKYKEALPDVNVYSMVVPIACEYYAPPEVAEKCSSQLDHINTVYENLKNIKGVDAYSALAKHVDEEIFLRTDHHWSSLGGFYAAQEFAKDANVPFLPLSDYEKRVNTGFCGTMYDYSGENEIIKNNPENFEYYVPQTVDYTATYYNYKISGWDVIGAYEPMVANFFLNYGDNRSDNYCTFMAGDAKIVHVKTNTKNGRKLAMIKDSYGNAMAGFLFGSFEDIYVTDLRFFSHNMIDFLKEKQITDLLFVNNTTMAGNINMTHNLDTIRTQEDMGF